ncbi:hypothetical protein ABZ631_06215 [Nocardiopsis alba]|uniref:hypothetical protein n=1 Tax=Nocardiopsis alba TaxID=53437 RepID=UPI0033F7DAF0
MTGILDVPAPLQDCDGLIDPSAFPIPTTDHVELRNQASALRKAGKGVAETGEDIVSTWGGLSACYTAPESEDLLGALAPVSAKGSDVESGTDRAAGALEDFADEVREIKMEWNDLRNRAAAFRERMLSEEDWKKSDHWFTSTSSNVEKSNAYRGEALALIKWYERAQRICANTISRGIVGRTVFVRGSSSQATTNPDAFVFDTIDTDADIPSVWGEPGTADQYWHQDALDAVWDFGVDAVQGTGAMLGMHSSEGWFEMSWGDALKEYHWDNLTSAASLIGMYDAETDSLGWSGTDTIHGAWRDLAHSVVPWEEWGDRPGYVIGTAALNVVGLVGGAALTATGVGAVVGVPLMAWRGMSIVDGMGGSGSRGGSGDGVETNISSPSMNLPNFGGNGSPVANLNFDSSDLSGFDPRQVSEIGASLERLYNSQQSGGTGSGEAAGGGRPTPSRPIGQDRSETSGQERRPAEDPRVDDMLTFEDIVNHPDNATLGDRLRTENQRALDQVDRDNKTRSNDTPASDEGTWTAREIIDGPEGDRSRVLTPAGGGHNDTFDASAANRPPSSPLHARADGIDGTGSGRGPGNEASDNNRGGDRGANMSDRSPTAHNQDGNGPTRNNLDDGASSNTPDSDFSRNSDSSPETNRGEDTKEPTHHNEENNIKKSENEKLPPSTRDADSEVIKNSGLEFEEGKYPEGGLAKIPPELTNGRILGRIPVENEGLVKRNSNGLIESFNGIPISEWHANLLKERTTELNLLQREEGFSFRALGSRGGAVNSIVIDLRTGIVAEGMNGRSGKKGEIPEEDTHPIIAERIEAMRGEYTQYDSRDGVITERAEKSEYPHTDKPRRHAEVKASNRILFARDSGDHGTPPASTESFRDLRVDNAFTFAERFGDCPCCANCTRITDGAPAPRTGKNIKNPHDPSNRRITGSGEKSEEQWNPIENDPFENN